MNFLSWISIYIGVNVAVVTGWSLSLAMARLSLRSRDQLWLNYVVVGLVLLALGVPLIPAETGQFFEPPVKLYAAVHAPDQKGEVAQLKPVVQILEHRANSFAVEFSGFVLLVLPLFGFLFLAKESIRLFRLERSLTCFRRVGSTLLYVSEKHAVPFAFWRPGRACVVIPFELLTEPAKLRMAVAHEIQHHRQGDTKWIFVLFLLRSICFLNPCAHIWARGISELQEYACDETLVDQEKVDSQAYARCLVETAQNTRNFERLPASATGMVFGERRQHLKWRIEKMFSEKIHAPGLGRPMKWISFLTLATLISVTSWAARGAVGDKRISMTQALEMAKRSESEFPVVVNDEVVLQLNRMVGTAEGRRWIRESMARMKNVTPLMKAKFQAYSAPEELYAIPLVESGYRNLAQSQKKGAGAGVWQFIASTARVFKLRVDQEVDERLDVEKETDAALRLLFSDRLRFDDWSLAILSFNSGERSVQAVIDKTGSRDAWTLVKAGLKTDANYLARVNAAILILRNPDLF
jgi:membrane-bound lytic murein transglycosylase D